MGDPAYSGDWEHLYDDDYFSQRIASRFWLLEAGKNNCR